MSLYKKFIAAVIPIVLLGTGALGYWSFTYSRDVLYRTEQQSMNLRLENAIDQYVARRYRLLENTGLNIVTSYVEHYKSEAISDFQTLSEKIGKRVLIFSRDGTALFCGGCEDDIFPDGWEEIALSVNGTLFGTHHAAPGDHAVFSAGSFNKAEWDWIILLTIPESIVSRRVENIRMATIIVSLASILAVAGMIAWVSLRLLVTPILKLKLAADSIARQEPIHRIDIDSNDELGRLARDMEIMSQKTLDYVDRANAASKAKSGFLAIISHEMRTPLNGVLGIAELLQGTNLDPDQKRKVADILASGRTLLAIINDVLDINRIESDAMRLEDKVFDLNELLSSIMASFQTTAEQKGLTVQGAYAISEPTLLRGDPARLRQILGNLLNNAMKFTDSGGVELTAEDISADSVPMPLSLPETKRGIRFAVTDTGAGIDPNRQESIFEVFTQQDGSISRKFGGAGLGLAIVRRLVELMGGRIGIESAVGKGTTVTVSIPFGSVTEDDIDYPQIDHPQSVTEADSEAKQTLSVCRILVAEDNAINAIVIISVLEKMGHKVKHVENGREAVDEVMRGETDLVLMDVHMPEMDGIEATREIRSAQSNNDIPIIGLTAEASIERHADFINAGMNDVLSKPFTKTQISQILSEYG